MRLIKLEEEATEYLCPECGEPMSSGIQTPDGDYDDWLIMPHCTKCAYEATSAKDPFDYNWYYPPLEYPTRKDEDIEGD